MGRFRRALGHHVVAWLLCQAATLTAGPAALLMGTSDAAAVEECTCVHGDHAICPMHHKAPLDPARCLLRSADHGDTALLSSVLGVTGLLPPAASVAVDVPVRAVVLVEMSQAPRRSVPPDPPPPRA